LFTFLDDEVDVSQTRGEQEALIRSRFARAGCHVDAFAAYQQRLMPFLRTKQKAAERLALSFAPKNRFQLFVRDTVMRMMALPGVAKVAAGNGFYDDKIELPPAPAV